MSCIRLIILFEKTCFEESFLIDALVINLTDEWRHQKCLFSYYSLSAEAQLNDTFILQADKPHQKNMARWQRGRRMHYYCRFITMCTLMSIALLWMIASLIISHLNWNEVQYYLNTTKEAPRKYLFPICFIVVKCLNYFFFLKRCFSSISSFNFLVSY